jgi:hypothetical protein
VPSPFNARRKPPPAAIAVTPERLVGTLHCPQLPKPPQPQTTGLPARRRLRRAWREEDPDA